MLTLHCILLFLLVNSCKWLSNCWLMPTQQFFSYIMARTSYFSMRWWWGQLCTRPTSSVGFFIVLAHWNNSLWIDMSAHSDTLSWFWANQFLLFLLNAACLVEKQQIPILLSLFRPNGGSNPQSTTLEASTLIITSPMPLWILVAFLIIWLISKCSTYICTNNLKKNKHAM